ncbi:hypothetical protein [Streptomyces piniterrae]|uniref:hypothetical protein n=1 Tax=Streptomyces piniterrae TaxID=2571125 RepID=UPI00145FCBCD|nr:hypothetical protein [Streptomyces piniterrae]
MRSRRGFGTLTWDLGKPDEESNLSRAPDVAPDIDGKAERAVIAEELGMPELRDAP